MADLVESLLTLARADEGRFDIHREPIALKPLVAGHLRDGADTRRRRGCRGQFAVHRGRDGDGRSDATASALSESRHERDQVHAAGGKVELGLGVHPDNVTFAVRDTGIGIAAADVPHIFERFWRADRARSRLSERGGFGLGLAISQWIAQAHGGTLTASSSLVGEVLLPSHCHFRHSRRMHNGAA